MNQKIDEAMADIEARAQRDDVTALADATRLVADHPLEPEAWSLRAYIFERAGNLSNAISDLTRAIELSLPEPSHFFDRGRYRLKLGEYSAAIEDFAHGLALCDQFEDDHYRESLHFFRADALVKLGRRHEALADLQHVRDDFTVWTTKLRSKHELLLECGQK